MGCDGIAKGFQRKRTGKRSLAMHVPAFGLALRLCSLTVLFDGRISRYIRAGTQATSIALVRMRLSP